MVGRMESKGERELLAIVFTDAVGSSSQTALDEDKSLSMLMADLDSIRNEAAARGGSVLKNTGDGLLISFKSAVDAIECALSIQKAFQGRPKGQGFQHKIGVHIGDVIKKDGDIFGAGVNTASRLVDQCVPGGICISSTLFELTKQKTEIGKLKLNEFLLQNIDPPTLAYQSGVKDEKEFRRLFRKKGNLRGPLLLGVAVVLLGLILGATPFLSLKSGIKDRDFGQTYGFEYIPETANGLKSEKYGKEIEFSLENHTGIGIELRWIDFDGTAKVSDHRDKELFNLGPERKEFRGTSGAGNIFSIRKAGDGKVLGYFRLLRGTKLNLVFLSDGDHFVVEPKYLREALQGDAVAQHRLAESFAWGNGVPVNDRKALFWAEKSAALNLPAGLGLLSVLLEKGRGTKRDLSLATNYRITAAEFGDPWSCYLLGKQYLEGRGVAKDPKKGAELLQRAVKAGVSPALITLGLCYENGWGIGVDFEKSKSLYQKALENGDPNAADDARERLEELRKRMTQASAVNSN